MKLKYLIVFVIFFLINSTYSYYYHTHKHNQKHRYILSSDSKGYYQYLTAVFYEKDIARQPYSICNEDGKNFNKYNYGVSLMELPFFLLSYSYCAILNIPTDGYTAEFSIIIVLASLTYAFIGLLYLFKYLRKKFDWKISLVATILIFYATNLFHYTTIEPGMSHSFSFCMVSLLLYFTNRFYEDSSLRNYFILGIIMGLITAIRPMNILFALLILFYNVYSFQDFKDRIIFVYRNTLKFLIIPAVTFLFFIPQFLYWKYITGHFITNPYQQPGSTEGFHYLTNPQVIKALFGNTGGWIIYTPIIVVVLAGLTWIVIKRKYNGLAVLFTFLPFLYLYTSWWCYDKIGLGNRFFIDIYPLLAIPLAFIVFKIKTINNLALKVFFALVIIIFLYYNIQMTNSFCTWWFKQDSWGWDMLLSKIGNLFFID